MDLIKWISNQKCDLLHAGGLHETRGQTFSCEWGISARLHCGKGTVIGNQSIVFPLKARLCLITFKCKHHYLQYLR